MLRRDWLKSLMVGLAGLCVPSRIKEVQAAPLTTPGDYDVTFDIAGIETDEIKLRDVAVKDREVVDMWEMSPRVVAHLQEHGGDIGGCDHPASYYVFGYLRDGTPVVLNEHGLIEVAPSYTGPRNFECNENGNVEVVVNFDTVPYAQRSTIECHALHSRPWLIPLDERYQELARAPEIAFEVKEQEPLTDDVMASLKEAWEDEFGKLSDQRTQDRIKDTISRLNGANDYVDSTLFRRAWLNEYAAND